MIVRGISYNKIYTMRFIIILPLLILCVTSGDAFHNYGYTCQYIPEDIVYLFYSLQNPNNPIVIPSNKPDEVSKTHFSNSKETIFFVHGSGGNSSGPLVQKVRTAIVNAKMDINIIGVDWRKLQIRNNQTNIYNCSKLFGKIVGDFLKEMAKKFGLDYSKLVIVGHSIAGTFCSDIGYNINSQAKSIVGLETCSYRNTAKFVECIHTGNENYSPMAHSNYYPNGGDNQPHCTEGDWKCNHWRVIDYYAESITSNKFVAHQCDNYIDYKAGKCKTHSTGFMGGLNVDTKAQGKFYLDTNDVPPYAKG